MDEDPRGVGGLQWVPDTRQTVTFAKEVVGSQELATRVSHSNNARNCSPCLQWDATPAFCEKRLFLQWVPWQKKYSGSVNGIGIEAVYSNA